MEPATIMLIKLASDVAMTAMKTIAEVDQMSEAQIQARIKELERTRNTLMDQIRSH